MGKIRLDIDKITPGMKLAEPITNASGVTLMPAGIRLTPMFILRLKKWNVDELDVLVEDRQSSAFESPDAPAPAEPPPRRQTTGVGGLSAEQEALARAIAMDVSRRFINVKDNELMKQLRSVVIKRLVAHGQAGLLNRLRRIGGAGEAEA